MGRQRVTILDMSEPERRHVLNELWEALSRREWVTYREALREAAPFRVVGGGSVASSQPSTVVTGRGLSGFTLPDPLMGVQRGFAFYLDGAAWDEHKRRLPPEALENMRAVRRVRALYVRQATPRGWTYRRNAGRGVSRALTLAMRGALALCEVVALSEEDVDTYLSGTTSVVRGLQGVTQVV